MLLSDENRRFIGTLLHRLMGQFMGAFADQRALENMRVAADVGLEDGLRQCHLDDLCGLLAARVEWEHGDKSGSVVVRWEIRSGLDPVRLALAQAFQDELVYRRAPQAN